MFCAYCGAMLEDGSVFCSNCGKKVIDNNVIDNNVIDTKVIENKVNENKVNENKVIEHKIFDYIEANEIEDLEVNSIEAIDSVGPIESNIETSQEVETDKELSTYEFLEPVLEVKTPNMDENSLMEVKPTIAVEPSVEEETPVEVEMLEEEQQPIELEQTDDFTVEVPLDLLEDIPVVKAPEPTIDFYIEEPTKQLDHRTLDQSHTNYETPTMEPEIDVRACNICGALLEYDSVFCPNCGSRVIGTGQDAKIASPYNYAPTLEASVGISEEEHQILLTNGVKNHKAKSKKRLIITAAILGVLVLALGGFFIFTKITLGNLEDSAIAFEKLVTEKGLEDYEEYKTLIKEAKEKASGWLVFGATDLEDRLSAASKDCESLSKELTSLMEKRSDYEDLDQSLILDSTQENTILEYLDEFDAAIALADTDKANNILTNLETTRQVLTVNNMSYIESLMLDLYNYDNPDFTQADWEDYNNQKAIAQNYIVNNQFLQAEAQIFNCTASRVAIEERIASEKKEAAIALLYAKPETLNVMISDVMYDDTSYRNEFEQALEAEIGIDVIFEQFEAESYYDAVNTVFAANTMPDVVYLSQDMYKEFQSKCYLTDLSQYWQESVLLSASNYYGEEAMERLKIDGQNYGFTPVRGFTCVTYIRQSWLDELGLSVPTTYEEFNQMLVAFTENKMGIDKSASYGMTAPGFLYNSEPYTSFLQPFYQNAVPEIYQSSSGEWVDGFVQQEMVDALYRLQEAYKLGLLDQSMAQRTVSEAISEFGSGKCGVISLWEGDGADYLIDELKKNGIEDDIIVMEPLTEMGSYVGKEPSVFAITTNCENPGGVMKYFFEPMLDGGAVQKLWTYGVEGYHWASVDTLEDALLGNPDNQLAALPYEGVNEITYNYNLIDPLRALATLGETDPGISQISDLAAISASIANQYYEASPNVKYNETYWYYFGEIQAAREEAVNKVMLEGVDPVTALDEYKYNVQYIMDQVLTEMNQL